MGISKKLAVFDIDGTISKEGNDSWFETTNAMVTNRDHFNEYLEVWKKEKSKAPYEASLTMMEQAISLFPEGVDSRGVYEKARELSLECIANDQIRNQCIEKIKLHYNDGFKIVFATTSYYEAGLAFLDSLAEKSIISQELAQSVTVSGTEVDWLKRKIVHFNMGDGKLEGVSRKLDSTTEKVSGMIQFAYGDDPAGNDSGIISVASYGFIIQTKKNATFDSNNMGERVKW